MIINFVAFAAAPSTNLTYKSETPFLVAVDVIIPNLQSQLFKFLLSLSTQLDTTNILSLSKRTAS